MDLDKMMQTKSIDSRAFVRTAAVLVAALFVLTATQAYAKDRPLSFAVSGVVSEVNAVAGKAVKAGAVLARLDGRVFAARVKKSQAAVAAATGGEACGTLDTAVRRAMSAASAGDVLLLSPACASWDQFVHFEARGDAFDRLTALEAKSEAR